MRAVCLIRKLPHYRREAFIEGLARAGFKSDDRVRVSPGNADLLVIWNRYGHYDRQAAMFEKAGRAVIVAENGYLDMIGTKKAFALSLNHHNGAGRWPDGPSRRQKLAVTLKPWRNQKGRVLILPQRGIGPPGVAMPRNWANYVSGAINIPKRVRPHPSTSRKRSLGVTPIERDLADVRCAVTWGSGAGLKALIEGVPVFHEFKRWIGRRGARFGLKGIKSDDPASLMGDREAMLDDVAAAQWSVEEVETGEPFKQLMDLHS